MPASNGASPIQAAFPQSKTGTSHRVLANESVAQFFAHQKRRQDMFKRFLFLSVGVVALVWVTANPAKLQAQHRGGGFRPSFSTTRPSFSTTRSGFGMTHPGFST